MDIAHHTTSQSVVSVNEVPSKSLMKLLRFNKGNQTKGNNSNVKHGWELGGKQCNSSNCILSRQEVLTSLLEGNIKKNSQTRPSMQLPC